MKKFANLAVELLTNEELMSVRGGDAPVDPIIIRPNSSNYTTLASTSTSTTITTTTSTTISF